jgi:uncharacterized protein with FMN-binding domain
LSLLLAAPSTFADSNPVDGTYDACVKTDSGTYRVPIKVEDGEVTAVRWPNDGRIRLRGAEIEDSEAVGRSSDGDRFRIEIDDLEYENYEGTGSE